MTTNGPLLVSGLGICLAFGFTSRSCPSKASGNTNWNTVGSLCRSLLIEHIVSGYPGSAAGLSQPCNFTIGTPKTEPLFPARGDTDVAEGSKILQPRPGFRHAHTAADGRSDRNKYISLSRTAVLIFHHLVTKTVASFRLSVQSFLLVEDFSELDGFR